MMLFEDTKRAMGDLILEVGQYADLQKQAAQRSTAKAVARLISTVTIGAVMLLLLAATLFFLCFALAWLLGQLLGSMPLGFAIVGGVLLLVLLLVWANRTRWIALPIHALVKSIVNPAETADTPQQLTQKLERSRKSIQSQMQQLRHPPKAHTGRERMTRWVDLGYTAYEAFRLGSSLLAVRGLLSRGKKRKRK